MGITNVGNYKALFSILGSDTLLKERSGRSRQAVKKYIFATYNVKNNAMTNRNINTAVRKWVDEGILAQPKGSSGPVKLVKKGASSSIAPKKREHQDYEAASTDAKKVRYFVTTVTFGIAL
ncbi:hypothetical protein SeMB42_g05042 [Synchytrium endobioticum]|uniref:Histone H1 n=1 Tax=Synchytrium endobioticum TaxID=286115 RepID=A0A507CU21_9FUNG|nr:hypothetical protein SeMB42_g05042 [Synchytrium endobioticum]